MKKIKLYGLIAFLSVLSSSCSELTDENVVFYSKDLLTKSLPVQIKDTEGAKISVNSNTVISLSSSTFFNENMIYLRDVSVPKMSFKIVNYSSNVSDLSNVKVFLDEIQITNDLGVDFLNVANNNLVVEIFNQELLTSIASKLLQNKQVVISYHSDAVTQGQLDFDFEFSITAKGTFVD